MKYSKKCDHCGHKNTAYLHGLNIGKVSALRKLVDRYEMTKAPVQLGDLGITNSQYTNFCHLAYFDLATHLTEGWIPTQKGIMFIYGEIGVQTPVAILNSEVLPLDHEAWATHNTRPAIAFVMDINNTAYKKRPEFQKEIAYV